MKLYSFPASSCSWRVRIALAVKGVSYDRCDVDIRTGKDEQQQPAYIGVNAMGQVPSLEWEEDGECRRLAQSLAIIEYLEEKYTEPALLPADRFLRAQCRQLAEIVNAGTQPLQNNRTLARLTEAGVAADAWAAHAIERGLAAFQALSSDTSGHYSLGDQVTIADICLVPQLRNARRYHVDLGPLQGLVAIEAACLELPAFSSSAA